AELYQQAVAFVGVEELVLFEDVGEAAHGAPLTASSSRRKRGPRSACAVRERGTVPLFLEEGARAAPRPAEKEGLSPFFKRARKRGTVPLFGGRGFPSGGEPGR